ncbi:monosaccharide ABC transporter membrane protein, CUT2 family [Microlunatus sagamiharensis]|uniref:Monosaccharide ABC transporter membrane protein, CUT2 family n=1 Tax=Microlunatus sagamiharensis TaxID=546874 RepID=A0A1H2MEY8_9ACTN|nr:ABC transporter permease [Microlunatus sagamiharensis]SDU91803.1 monosaccharide ABC transporter membrane protein, CUT2 family [Microlunatus sagamiharensis]
MTASTVTIALPRRGSLATGLQRWGVYIAIALLLLFDLAFTPDFVSVSNLRTQLVQVVPVLVVALGMALVIGTEGIDLSVGGVMAIAAAVLPLYIGYGFWPAAVVALVAGALVGLANGSLVAFVGVQPIVATLALMVAGRGIALLIANEQLVPVTDPTALALGRGSLFGVLPWSVLIAALLVVGVAVLVSRTTFGKQLVAIGGNRRASELAGLPVKRNLLVVYMLAATLAASAGVLSTARLGASVPSTLGNLIELSAITAVVVGGTPLSGGMVKIGGTVAGALLLQLLRATLIAHDISDWYSQIVQAVIIVVAVYLQRQRAVLR